jgi:F0F1-type ATP synthase assembly protein I
MSLSPEKKDSDRPESPAPSGSGGGMAYLGLGFEFMGAFLLMTGLGYLLDYWLSESGRPGLFLIIGLFLGFGAGLWHLIRRTNQMQEWDRQEEAAQRTEPARYKDIDIETQVQRIAREVDAVHQRIDTALKDHAEYQKDRAAQKTKRASGESDQPGATPGSDPGSFR